MIHVQKNILKFYSKLNEFREEGKYTDVTVHCQSKSFKCHRLVLTMASRHFEVMYENSSKESPLESIVLVNEVSETTFEEVLHFMYTGHVDVNATNVYALLRTSDYFSLSGIEDLCLKFISGDTKKITIQHVFPLFSYACDTRKNKFVKILLGLIVKHFGVWCKQEEFLEISFDRLQMIVEKYSSLSSRNEELLLTAVLRWICYKREERVSRYYNQILEVMQFADCISSPFVEHVFQLMIDGKDLVIALQKPGDYSIASESQKDKILKDANCLHVYVKYKNEKKSWMQIFSINSVCKCINSGKVLITDETEYVRCAVSDDSYLYCLAYVNEIPKELNREVQTFSCHTSVNRRVTHELTPPPIVFASASLCYLQKQNNIYAYDERFTRYSVVRTNSRSCKMFDDEEINRGIFAYNCTSDDWYPIAPMKKRLCYSCMTVCENTLYLIGGKKFHSSTPTKGYAQAFDFRSGWRMLPKSRNIYYGANCCSLKGKIYVCGGLHNKRSAERYDPIANKWETIRPMNDDAVFHRFIPFKNKLWAMGSYRINDDGIYYPSNNLSMNVYNVTSNRWSEFSKLTKAAADLTIEPIAISDCVVFGM